MLPTLILLYAVVDLSLTSESIQDTSPNILGEKRGNANQGALSFIASINNKPPVNRTYYDKEVNPLRVPNKFYEEQKKKNKVIKSPKRTIQKIIRNGKSRNRKIYVHPVTRQPTVPSADIEIQYTNTQRNIELRAPTEHIHRRKSKKPLKVIRYPMPFHKFPKKDINSHKRNRRDVDRDDVFIIKDLDEIEFLSKEEDNDVVRAHVQNYW